jgi:hypothetical protein
VNAKLKQKTCANKGCKVKFTQFNSIQTWCSPKCGQEMAQSKVKVNYKAETNRLKKDYYDKDLNHQKKLTQDVFNKLRKLQEFEWFADRGLEPECISCGKKNMDWCCGHLKTVASQGALRFDKINTYLQCNRYCNKALSANLNGNRTTRGYLVGLAERFGDVEAKRIIEYCNVDKIKTWECDELIAMRKEMSKEIRRLGKKLNI